MDFTYDGILFSTAISEIAYDNETQTITCSDYNDADEPINAPISQYSEEILSEWNAKVTEEDRCHEVIYWVTDNNFIDQDVFPIPKDTPDFFFYDPKRIAASLEKFIAEH